MFNNNQLDTEYYSDLEVSKIFLEKSSTEISCLYVNIRSIVCNYDILTRFIKQLKDKPDIIALSETKITTQVNQNANVEMPGYVFKYTKSSTMAGGVGFYISDQLDFDIRGDLGINKPECHCETLFIQLESKQKCKQIFGIFYRHPRYDYQKFAQEYEKLLLKLTNEKCNFLITGDFNIDFLRIGKKPAVEKFADMVYSSGAFMPINQPTRVPIHTEKCCGQNNKKLKKCKRGQPSILDHAYLNNLH